MCLASGLFSGRLNTGTLYSSSHTPWSRSTASKVRAATEPGNGYSAWASMLYAATHTRTTRDMEEARRSWPPPPRGLRPLPDLKGICDGRLTLAVTDLGGDVVAGSCYGLSGLPLSKQMPLWCALVQALRSLGLPFVIGGDWQRPPREVEGTGLLKILRAAVCASNEATNLRSGNELDWFLVSDCLHGGRWEAMTYTVSRLLPTLPLRCT